MGRAFWTLVVVLVGCTIGYFISSSAAATLFLIGITAWMALYVWAKYDDHDMQAVLFFIGRNILLPYFGGIALGTLIAKFVS